MKCLRIEPQQRPVVCDIGSDLEDLQAAVGGLVECIYPWDDDDAAILCNEEGKLEGQTLNRAIRDEDGEIYDVIAGTMLIVGLTEDDFGSLSDDQIKTYTELFWRPEVFMSVDGQLIPFQLYEDNENPFEEDE